MEIDRERKKLPPRETLSRVRISGGVFFGLPLAVFGGALLSLAFGPAELRAEIGDPPVLLFAVPGALVTGLGVMFLGSASRRRAQDKRVERGRQRSPGNPWSWDHTWKQSGVRSAAGRWTIKSLAFFVLGAMFMTPFNWWAFFQGGPWLAKIVTGLFDLVLALALVGLGLGLVSYLRFGNPMLHFARFPFRLGEELNVRLDRPRRLPSEAAVRCTLRCIQERIETETRRVRRDGRWTTETSVRTVCDQLWSASQSCDGNGHAPHLELRFPLPEDDRLSTRLSESPARYWELEVHGNVPGLDYLACFLVPVYA